MNLPPLPLIGGALFIDNSSWVEGFNTCYRYLQYRSLNKRISAGESAALNFGSALHLALEHRYKKYQNQQVPDPQFYNEVSEIFTAFYAEHPVPSDDWRTLNHAMNTVRRYNERYGQEEFQLLAAESDIQDGQGKVIFKKGESLVEMPFALPLYTHYINDECLHTDLSVEIPIIYTGKIDLPVILDSSSIFILDHKTTSYGGDMFWNEQRMTSQQRGYVWAFEQLTGKTVSGYMIDMIRTKEPPKYVLEGKTFTRGGKTGTAESWWQESLQRERFLTSQTEIAEWKNNTIDLVEEFFWHYSRGYMPMKTKWCSMYGKCPYYDVCRLPSEDRGLMLASGQFQDNLWSPLKH